MSWLFILDKFNQGTKVVNMLQKGLLKYKDQLDIQWGQNNKNECSELIDGKILKVLIMMDLVEQSREKSKKIKKS